MMEIFECGYVHFILSVFKNMNCDQTYDGFEVAANGYKGDFVEFIAFH